MTSTSRIIQQSGAENVFVFMSVFVLILLGLSVCDCLSFCLPVSVYLRVSICVCLCILVCLSVRLSVCVSLCVSVAAYNDC